MNYTERTRLIDGLAGAALMALLVEGVYGFIDGAFTVFNYNYSTVTNVIYILGGIALAISLFMLMKAYRNEKPMLASYGLEILVLAISSAILPSTYMELSFPLNKLNVLFPYVFGVYYIMKSMYIISKKNLSNSLILGGIELVYITLLTFGLLGITEALFIAGSVITVGTFIHAIRKKSKIVLVHALELMIATFSMLIIKSSQALVFFGVMFAVYYLLKSIYVTLNYSNSNSNKSKKSKGRK